MYIGKKLENVKPLFNVATYIAGGWSDSSTNG